MKRQPNSVHEINNFHFLSLKVTKGQNESIFIGRFRRDNDQWTQRQTMFYDWMQQ